MKDWWEKIIFVGLGGFLVAFTLVPLYALFKILVELSRRLLR